MTNMHRHWYRCDWDHQLIQWTRETPEPQNSPCPTCELLQFPWASEDMTTACRRRHSSISSDSRQCDSTHGAATIRHAGAESGLIESALRAFDSQGADDFPGFGRGFLLHSPAPQVRGGIRFPRASSLHFKRHLNLFNGGTHVPLLLRLRPLQALVVGGLGRDNAHGVPGLRSCRSPIPRAIREAFQAPRHSLRLPQSRPAQTLRR